MKTYHHFLINSCDRDDINTIPANCRINLPKLINPICAELSFAQIPNTYYNINTSNNAIGTGVTTYFITPGCYSLTDLLQALATLLNSITPTITYDDITNKISISAPLAFTLDFTVPNSLYHKLGFRKIIYEDSTLYTASFGPHVFDNFIFININDIPGGVMTSNKNMYNASFVVPNICNKSEIIQFYAHSQFYLNPRVNTSNLQYLDIKIHDSDGRLLDGLSDWSMMIKFEI